MAYQRLRRVSGYVKNPVTGRNITDNEEGENVWMTQAIGKAISQGVLVRVHKKKPVRQPKKIEKDDE